MIIEFTIDPANLFYSVMDKTILDKTGLEAQGVQVGDRFALSKNEEDAFRIELDNAINHLCIKLPFLEWEPNDGIEMRVESKKEIKPHSLVLLIDKALQELMLFWWYEVRNPNYAAIAEQRAKATIAQIRKLVEGAMTERPYRYF